MHNNRRMVGQLGTQWAFCTNHGQYMCSNHPWPLLWQRALGRSLWPNYPAFIRSRQGVTGVFRKCFGRGCNHLNTIERERQITFCSACMCYGLTWTFCMDEKVCLLLWMKGSLFCFRNVTMAVEIGLRSRDSRRNEWILFATTWQ